MCVSKPIPVDKILLFASGHRAGGNPTARTLINEHYLNRLAVDRLDGAEERRKLQETKKYYQIVLGNW